MDRYDPRVSGDDMVDCDYGYYVKHEDAMAKIAELEKYIQCCHTLFDKVEILPDRVVITKDTLTVHVVSNDEGISVDMYPNPMMDTEEPINSGYTFFSEGEKDGSNS
jgi:hypothetical protein